MKYLIINCSPHKGNSWLLAEQIKTEILCLSNNVVFKEIHLSDLNLPFCSGCSACFRKGHEYCPHYNTTQFLIDQIDWCDGVIFVSSTYNMQPNALTKNLIDHLCFMLHRPRFFTKKAFVISTTGGIGAKKTVKYITGTLKGLGFNKCYSLPVKSYSWNDYKIDYSMNKICEKKAKKFHYEVSIKKLHAPTFSQVMIYNLFRGMSQAYVEGTAYETYDGVHWSDPERKKKTYDPKIHIPLYKSIIGRFFFRIAKKFSVKKIVTYKK